MNADFPLPFKYAKRASNKSTLRTKVGACLVVRKSILEGYNKDKTHTKYANPNIHIRTSVHAELDCLNRAPISENGTIYVYREVAGKPAMARPCNHCMTFLRKSGIKKIYYTIPHEPFWEEEEI